jgi:hypothetical protein
MSGFPNLVAAFLFLILGLAELAIVQRAVYPVLRWRHEEAKVLGRRTTDPNRVMLAIKVQSLVVMPLVGYLLGSRLKAMMG